MSRGLSVKTSRYRLFAVSPPGLEEVVCKELQALGVQGRPVAGGVEFSGDLSTLYRANLWLRAASRVLLRVGIFKALDFQTLVKKVQGYPWEIYLRHAEAVKVRVKVSSCRLYHSQAVAQRVIEGMGQRLGRSTRASSSHSDIRVHPSPL